MTPDEMKAKILTIDQAIRELKSRKAALNQNLAHALSPFKVGDRLTFQDGGPVWEIARITLGWDQKPDYSGFKIKKNGEPGASMVSIYSGYGKEPHLADPIGPADEQERNK